MMIEYTYALFSTAEFQVISKNNIIVPCTKLLISYYRVDISNIEDDYFKLIASEGVIENEHKHILMNAREIKWFKRVKEYSTNSLFFVNYDIEEVTSNHEVAELEYLLIQNKL